eukprot:TRINITY_DN52921_c0_g1_i1.p4 TRINITY_DN52921_c0_g1~~TRINITY_DN52921_c0_g1_i1.p4  ORF type:complete len:101 (-),score=8.18 TRINITY_DN52921_c0_g1_i1:48-350(-)
MQYRSNAIDQVTSRVKELGDQLSENERSTLNKVMAVVDARIQDVSNLLTRLEATVYIEDQNIKQEASEMVVNVTKNIQIEKKELLDRIRGLEDISHVTVR